MGTSDHIYLGVGKLWIAKFTSANIAATIADLPAAYDADWTPNYNNSTPRTTWTDMGYTRDGVKFDYTPKIFEVLVDQATAPVQTYITGEDCTLTSKLAEATLLNLYKTMLAATPNSSTATTVVMLGGGALNYYSLCYVGPGPNLADHSPGSGQTIILINKVGNVGTSSIEFKKEDITMIPISFKGLSVSGMTAGRELATLVQFENT